MSRPFGDTLLVQDLALSLDDVPGLLEVAIASGDPQDAYLLAAGASQAIRDALEDDPASVLRAAATVSPSLPAALRTPVRRGARALSRAIVAARDASGARRPLAEAADRLDELVGELAHHAMAGEWRPDAAKLATELLVSGTVRNGAARGATLTLPSCFRSFDLHPRDLRRLARIVEARLTGPAPRVLVLGVRTSGSYLAPLLAAALRLDGIAEVVCRTTRPGRTPPPALRELLADRANDAWSLVVVDDPPDTGRALGRAARQAVDLGFPADAVCLAFALHEGGAVPAGLARYSSAVLDWAGWDVHQRLGAPAVARLLAEREGGPGTLASLEPVALPPRPSPHGHARVGYRATYEDGSTCALVAEGTGLGYLGRHALAVADAIRGHVPVLAYGDGVLVRRWLPEEARAPLDTAARVEAAVDYVVARRAALPARRDAAATMAGRQPCGRSRAGCWPPRTARRAWRCGPRRSTPRSAPCSRRAHPSVVDGAHRPRRVVPRRRRAREGRRTPSARSRTSTSRATTRPTTSRASPPAPRTRRSTASRVHRYEDRTGERVDHERLLLYRLVHLWDRARVGELDVGAAETKAARAWQDWSRARLLDGALDQGTGPWCVLDVDGVLEGSRLGAPTLTPASAAGLRALRDHSFRPLLATGRGYGDLVDRCVRYGLLGGVAEYGGVVYDHRRGVRPRARRPAGRARPGHPSRPPRGRPGRLDRRGLPDHGPRLPRRPRGSSAVPRPRRRSSRPAAAARGASARSPAIAQTDFVAFGVDKGHGVRALLELLDAPGEIPALCVGDSEADVPMLRLGALARVPGNAAALAGHGIVATAASFQRGFKEAVDAAVGHGASPCGTCAPAPALPVGAALLEALLAGLEGGRATGLAAVPAIARRARAVTAEARRTAGPA